MYKKVKLMEDVIIVKASVADADDLLALGKQTYTETFAPHNTKENLDDYLNKVFTLTQLKKELTNANSQWYFALSNNERVGYLKVNFGSAQTELQDKRAMEIERIYVLQRYQGSNIGTLLLKKAIAIAQQHCVAYVWLGVWEKNTKAQAFYKKHQFVIFDQHSFFVGNDEQTDWMMRLTLKNIVIPISKTKIQNG